MTRVLIVDGQDEVRHGLRMRLAIEPDIKVLGETGKEGEALYLAHALDPDVILVDVEMRGASGADIITRLRETAPRAAVVVLTLYGDDEIRALARDAGADAFLEKRGGTHELLQTIRRVAPPWTANAATAPESVEVPQGPQMG